MIWLNKSIHVLIIILLCIQAHISLLTYLSDKWNKLLVAAQGKDKAANWCNQGVQGQLLLTTRRLK